MPAKEFIRRLRKEGCIVETKPSGHGHVVVRRGKAKTEVPIHGHGKELGTGLVNKIFKDLGLK